MTPEQVAASSDQVAERWLDVSTYGFAQIERAIAFVKNKGAALDAGCGTGRCIGLLARHGFATDGIDVSTAMIALARGRRPEARLFQADICRWELPRAYALVANPSCRRRQCLRPQILHRTFDPLLGEFHCSNNRSLFTPDSRRNRTGPDHGPR